MFPLYYIDCEGNLWVPCSCGCGGTGAAASVSATGSESTETSGGAVPAQ